MNLTVGKSRLFLKFYFIILFQTPRVYFEDFEVSLKTEQELLLNAINLVLLSEWLVVAIRFIVKITLLAYNVTFSQ